MYLIFHESRILVRGESVLVTDGDPVPEAADPPGGPLFMETDRGRVRIQRWEGSDPDAEGDFRPLRHALGVLDDEGAHMAGRARQLLQWRLDHRFCGRCGRPTALAPRGSSLTCTGCGMEHFPRVTPAVIVLVHDERRILLGRAPRFPDGMYSTLAGFVEPGESAEECVHREVLEESGVRVADLEYRGSQSWPFPHSLMLGYRARYAGGEIRCEDDELEDVAWFSVDNLPRLPTRRSIARRLIQSYLATLSSHA